MENKRRNNLLQYVFLFLFLLVSFGQTLKMNFWRDDYTMLFKLQHSQEQASHFGENGLIGSGPYKYILLPHALFFPIFKLNPLGYFIVGLILYSMAMYAIYFFVNELLKSKKAALFASLVFAAGYIASDGLFRIINSWQNSIGQILALLAFSFYVKFFNKKGLKYYFLALGLYIASIEFVFVRSHSLIAIIFALDLLLGLLPNIKRNLPAFVFRQLPFWVLFKFKYLQNSQIADPGIKERFASIFIDRNFGELTPLFANIGNVLVPDKLQSQVISFFTKLVLKSEPVNSQIFWVNIFVFMCFVLAIFIVTKLIGISKKYIICAITLLFLILILNFQFITNSYYWYKDIQTVISGMIGMSSFVLSLLIFIAFWNKNKKVGTAVLLGWMIIASQVFGYYISYYDAIFESTHRYLSNAFLGYCVLMGGLVSVFLWTKAKSKLKTINYVCLGGLFILIFINLKLNINSQNKFVREISVSSRQFYKDLKNYIPDFEKGSLLYFDIQDDSFYQHQFDEFSSVGSMPNSTAIAVYYGIDRYNFFQTSNYNEVLAKVAKKELNINQIYSFYYGANGLKNTTNDFRNLLLNGGKEVDLISSPVKFENSNTFERQLDDLTPLLLQMDISLLPLIDKLGDTKSTSLTNYSFSEKLDFINYLKSKNDYYKTSKVTALSDWEYQKVDNVIDNDTNTFWRGDRLYWHDNQNEAVTIDLGNNKQISKMIWVNSNRYWTPTSYMIEVSLDNLEWSVVKNVENAKERKDGEVVIEEFPSTLARYVKMNFSKTVTDDSPAIAELEVIEDRYSKVDIINANDFIKNPFSGTVDKNELVSIYDAFAPLAEINVSINTDKGELFDIISIPVIMGERAVYQGVIPAYGTTVKSITLEIKNIPALFNIYDLSVINMSLSELERGGLIKIFEEN